MDVRSRLLQSFREIKWDLEGFIAKRQLNQQEEAHFLSALLYVLYYREFLLSVLPYKNGANPWFFWNFLAETLSQERLEQILAALPVEEKEELAFLCGFYPREGSWAILRVLKKGTYEGAASAITAAPSILRAGYDRIVYALATRGNDFERQPWLISLLEGLKPFLKEVGGKPNPIIIFDQAALARWKKNHLWIESLSSEYGVPIVHLSSRETLSYAKKLGVADWIHTQKGRRFGYAGSRNALFFLAPVLFQAFRENRFDQASLRRYFQEAVLGDDHKDLILHLGEEDVLLPAVQLWIDAQNGFSHQDQYFCLTYQYIGRATHQINPLMDLKQLLEDPSRLYSSTGWISSPQDAGMKGMLTKPRFCLPIPFGNEEIHALPPHRFVESKEPYLIHLGGTRFPHRLYPKSPLDGIFEYLKQYIPYSYQVSMVSALIDSGNTRGRCLLSWNEKRSFHSLQELLKDVFLPEVQEKLREQFWVNFEAAFKDSEELYLRCLKGYAEYDPAIKAPAALKRYYAVLQKEAELTLRFAKELIRKRHAKEALDPEKTLLECKQSLPIKKQVAGFADDLLLLIQRIESFYSFSF